VAVRQQPKPSPYDRCLCGGQRRFCGDEFRLAALGDLIGTSAQTVYRVLWGQRVGRDSRWRLARLLGEDVWTLWPPMPRKRQPGGSRKRVAA
jgi:hypothetical protein